MIKNRFKQLNSILANLFVSRKVKLTHIVETHNWAIQEVGTSITNSLNSQGLIHTRVAYSPIGLRNQIVHFDCVHTLIKSGRIKPIHDSNRIVLTWFHVEPGDPRLKQLAGIQQEISHIHTSCVSTKQTLVQAGICADKIVVIPLGVDTHLFTPAIDDQKNTIRDRLGISHNRLIIGSFQKDGVGWGEGLEPKLIKGPDVLMKTVARRKKYNPLLLLTGPSRGYVKSRLDDLKIDYIHTYLQDSKDLPNMYRALDLYIIASRVEGGPMSLLQSWACGIPVVSTRVGMVTDLAKDLETAMVCEIENVESLVRASELLINHPQIGAQLAHNALAAIHSYDWTKIAQRYYQSLYL